MFAEIQEFTIDVPHCISSIEEFHKRIAELLTKYGLQYDIEKAQALIEEEQRDVLHYYWNGQPLQNWLAKLLGKELHKELVRNNNWSRIVNELRQLYASGELFLIVTNPDLFDTLWYRQFNCNDEESCFRIDGSNHRCVLFMERNRHIFKLAVMRLMSNGRAIDARMWVLHTPDWSISLWFNLYSPRKELFERKEVRLSIAKIVEDKLLKKEVFVKKRIVYTPPVYCNNDYGFTIVDKEMKELDDLALGKLLMDLDIAYPCGLKSKLDRIEFVSGDRYNCLDCWVQDCEYDY